MGTEIKLTQKQKQVVRLMQEGWGLFIGNSETNGRQYYNVSKEFTRVYFNATVFSNLLSKGLIYQEQRHFEYVLTEIGESIKL